LFLHSRRRLDHFLGLGLLDSAVCEVLEVALKLEGDFLVEEIKSRTSSFLEAFQISELLIIRSSSVGLIDYSLDELPHILVVQERSFEVGLH